MHKNRQDFNKKVKILPIIQLFVGKVSKLPIPLLHEYDQILAG